MHLLGLYVLAECTVAIADVYVHELHWLYVSPYVHTSFVQTRECQDQQSFL